MSAFLVVWYSGLLAVALLLPSEGHLSAGAEVSANVTGVTTGATTAPKDH